MAPPVLILHGIIENPPGVDNIMEKYLVAEGRCALATVHNVVGPPEPGASSVPRRW